MVDLTDLEAVAKAVDEHTACLFLEIVTNPQLEVADLPALSRIVRQKHVPLIADTTFIPFTEFDAQSAEFDLMVGSS